MRTLWIRSSSRSRAISCWARSRSAFRRIRERNTTKRCICGAGFFLLFEDNPRRGYGISCVTLFGHEAGVADDTAQEILDFHREHPDKATFAAPLLVWSEFVDTIAELDRGYELLLQGGFVRQVDGEVIVVSDESGRKVKRPKFALRASPKTSVIFLPRKRKNSKPSGVFRRQRDVIQNPSNPYMEDFE